jgi:hypothetical protein
LVLNGLAEYSFATWILVAKKENGPAYYEATLTAKAIYINSRLDIPSCGYNKYAERMEPLLVHLNICDATA